MHLQDGQACRRSKSAEAESEEEEEEEEEDDDDKKKKKKIRREEAVGTRADLGSDQGWSHVLHLQDGQAGQLFVDALEDVVVEVPGLVQLRLLAAVPVLVAPLICL